MPGTLALSVQGASLYQQQYVLAAVILAICLVSAWLSYRYKDDLYKWMDKMNGKSSS
jgi:NO-binding membrane sensor protein with MHYT domain